MISRCQSSINFTMYFSIRKVVARTSCVASKEIDVNNSCKHRRSCFCFSPRSSLKFAGLNASLKKSSYLTNRRFSHKIKALLILGQTAVVHIQNEFHAVLLLPAHFYVKRLNVSLLSTSDFVCTCFISLATAKICSKSA